MGFVAYENGRVAVDDKVESNCELSLRVFRYPINAEYSSDAVDYPLTNICICSMCIPYMAGSTQKTAVGDIDSSVDDEVDKTNIGKNTKKRRVVFTNLKCFSFFSLRQSLSDLWLRRSLGIVVADTLGGRCHRFEIRILVMCPTSNTISSRWWETGEVYR